MPGRRSAETSVSVLSRHIGVGPALVRVLWALGSRDLAAVRPQFEQLTVPTLIVWGTGDVLLLVLGQVGRPVGGRRY